MWDKVVFCLGVSLLGLVLIFLLSLVEVAIEGRKVRRKLWKK